MDPFTIFWWSDNAYYHTLQFFTVGGEVLDFYIFWKFGFCRTLPSTRQLFYRLVNLPSPHPTLSIHLSSLHSPFPHPTFIQIFSHTHPSPISYPTPHFPPFTYPQVIHNLSTAFPQVKRSLLLVIHNPYHFNRPFIYPNIPTSIAISPIIPIIIPTQFPSKVIHRYTKLSTSYPQSNILIHRLSTDISILSYV